MKPRTPALLVAAALLLASASPGLAAGGPPAFVPGESGFRSVLAYGQGQSTNAVDLARNLADGTVPSSFTDQGGLYDAVITGQPTTQADLARYYKDSSFSVPVGGATETVGAATVIRDAAHHVPHVYAPDRASGMYAVGYATAQDRLFLMDVLRRTSEGSTAELLGPSAVASDSAALGQFDRSPEELTAEVMRLPQDEGAEGAQGLADLQQYVAGINAWIAATRTDPTKLPAEYPALGTLPRDWTLADTAAEAYLLIAQFTVAGDREDAQSDILSRLQAKLGAVKGRAVFDDLRRLEDPLAPVTTTRRFTSDRPAAGPASANTRIDAGSLSTRSAVASTTSPAVPAVPPLGMAWARDLAAHGLRLPGEASNALLVSAAHSASGHALAAMGPQVSYYSPEILVEYELHVPGLHASGMSFPGASPFPLIGHTTDFAWTGTTALGDNADTFAEQLCNADGSSPTKDSKGYRYRGTCRAFTSRDQVLHTPLNPTDPTTPPSTVTLRTLRSVHGPVYGYGTSGGRPVALVRSVGVVGAAQGIRSLVAFEQLAEGKVHSPQDFVATMRHYTGNENWFYVSKQHIGWLASGWFQQHAPGTDVDLPVNGDGTHDWKGFDPATGAFTRFPDSFNPTSVDPAQGYLTSWNNKAAPGWHASSGTWSFGRVQRVELLEKPTRAAIARGRLTLPQVVGISGNASTQDLRGVEVLPDLLRALGPVTDPTQAALVRAMRSWVAAGAHRRATGGRSYDDDSAAVLAFDAWWRSVVHAVFDPQFGTPVLKQVETAEDLVLDSRAVQTGFFDGWHSQLSSVVRASLGTRDADAPRALRCGTGTLSSCRTLLRAALASSTAALVRRLGADVSTWRKPVLCRDEAEPTCDENRPLTAGAIATPSHPFENRGTYHQAVELGGSTPLVVRPARAPGSTSTPATGAPGPRLATTGGAPLLGVGGLLVLSTAVLLRRRRPTFI